jgi:zinc protease
MKKLAWIIIAVTPAVLSAAGDFRLTVLDNGLTLYTREDHSKPLISLFSVVDGGSRTETADIAGLSHFYEHLIARGGSKRQGETEFRRRMNVLGEERIYTYDDGTAYGLTVPTRNFPEALWRLADFMLDLKPDSASILKERTIVMEEYKMSYADNPGGRVYEMLFKAAFTNSPYYPTTIGLPEVIRTADYNKLKTFYEERYVPNQIVMTVVGDFQTEALIQQIRDTFGGYKPGRISFESGRVEPPQTAFRQTSDSMEVSSTYVLLGYHLPPTASADTPALRVLSSILGEGGTSRLEKALKLEENLVLYVYSSPDFMRDASLLYVGLQCDPEKEERALRKVFAQIQKLATQGVTAEELAAAQEKLIAEDIMANETYMGQAENNTLYAVRKSQMMAVQMQDLIRSVRLEDVSRVARRYLDPTNATLAIIIPNGSPVRDYAPIAAEYAWMQPKAAAATTAAATRYLKLPNGLTLIAREDHASPTACVSVFIRGGQWLEPEGKSGVAYLTAAMLNRGTQEFSREEFQAEKERLGINLWNYAAGDFLQAGFTGLSDRMSGALHLLDQMLFHPTFPEIEFSRAKDDQLQAVKAVEDQPWEYTHREALADLYKQSPYRRLVIGAESDIRNLSREDILTYYRTAFAPSNIVIAAAGDFDAEQLLQELRGFWGDQPAQPAPVIKPIMDKPVKGIHTRSVFKDKDQNTFNYSWLAPAAADPDFLPMVLTKRILSTKLFYKWIYDVGIAYRMWTRMFPALGQSRFYFEMGVSDGNFDRARQGVLADLQAFLSQPVSADDLALAKQDESTRHSMIYQTNQGVADGLGSWEALGLGYRFFEEFPNKLETVTAKQVESAARKYLSGADYHFVNIGRAKVE